MAFFSSWGDDMNANDQLTDREREMLSIIAELRSDLRDERAYSQQLREKSVHDLRELREVRQALRDVLQQVDAARKSAARVA